MARNAEKSQSMLFRFRATQAAESGLLSVSGQRRPKAPSTISSIPLCEKWRGQILKEISRKVLKIQDESLSDFQIRDLNDEINKCMKEKWGWERRIRELGGPNYMRGGGTVFDDQGREVQGGGKGYRYFGRARELPGVKEMFERAAKRQVRGDGEEEQRVELRVNRRDVDARYFGYGREEEDAGLLKYERKKEREAEERLGAVDSEEDEEWEPLPGDVGDGKAWRLPTLDEVQEELVERRRRKVLDSIGYYAYTRLQDSDAEANADKDFLKKFLPDAVGLSQIISVEDYPQAYGWCREAGHDGEEVLERVGNAPLLPKYLTQHQYLSPRHYQPWQSYRLD